MVSIEKRHADYRCRLLLQELWQSLAPDQEQVWVSTRPTKVAIASGLCSRKISENTFGGDAIRLHERPSESHSRKSGFSVARSTQNITASAVSLSQD